MREQRLVMRQGRLASLIRPASQRRAPCAPKSAFAVRHRQCVELAELLEAALAETAEIRLRGTPHALVWTARLGRTEVVSGLNPTSSVELPWREVASYRRR